MQSLIFDLQSVTLSSEERELLKHPAALGIILFTRNYENKQQLKELIKNIRAVNPNLITMADQEGGPVQRFREGFTELPSMYDWTERYVQSPEKTLIALKDTIHTMITELDDVDVDLTLLPVLDVNYADNTVIGRRSFGKDLDQVVKLAGTLIEAMHEFGMPVTGKHFPGHGSVLADSHHELPVDTRSFSEIAARDLIPFSKLVHQLDLIMPAHVVYPQCDEKPAGFSRFWLKTILRDQLKFSGIIISDDLTMKGAAGLGNYPDRAYTALEAGCDCLLVCNNRLAAIEVLESLISYKNKDSEERINDLRRKIHVGSC